MTQLRRLVLTGGPGAGKSVIARHLAMRFPEQCVAVPEAATLVYQALQTRWDKLDTARRCAVQLQIYQLQVEQEQAYARQYPGLWLVLDRGTLDGAVYWPAGPDDYWAHVGSTPDEELRRYDCVIWLESGAAIGRYDGDASNPVRFESAQDALLNGRRLLELWSSHPNLHQVQAFDSIEEKIAAIERLFAMLVER